MCLSPAVSTRVPGACLLVVLSLVLVLRGPAPALGALGDPDPVGVWPLAPAPQVVHAFDPPATPYAAGHRGVDLLGSVGQPVRAALPGRVTFAGVIAGRGVVVVDHGATRTTYEPVGATVGVGAEVAAGARIGTLQLTLSHCFPAACLHWGWIAGETYLDPLRLVGLRPVRLLPLWSAEPVGARAGPPASPRTGVAPLPNASWLPLLRLLRLLPLGGPG